MTTVGGPDEKLFDAAFLDGLCMLAVRLRKRKRLTQRGNQSTPSAGSTKEFKDYRHYSPREDYRAIDWRLYARLDRLYVRLYEETQELNLHIVVDSSASMRAPFLDKRKQALRFAIALAYLGLSGQQRVSLYSMSESIRQELPPLRGQGNMEKLMQVLKDLPFEGMTNLQHCFETFRPARQRYGVIFVISDFFGQDTKSALGAVAHAAAWPGETHFLQILHPEEREPQLEGEVEVDEVETGERQRFWFTPLDARKYTETFDQFVQSLSLACAGRQIGFMQCTTNESFEGRFLDWLSRGSLVTRG